MAGNVRVPPRRTLSVVIAHRDDVVRDGLAAALGAHDDLAVIATAATGTEAVTLLGNGLSADVVVIDDLLPDVSANDLCARVRRLHADVACIVHSTSGLSTFRGAGAAEMVPKQLDSTDLAAAIRRAAAGR